MNKFRILWLRWIDPSGQRRRTKADAPSDAVRTDEDYDAAERAATWTLQTQYPTSIQLPDDFHIVDVQPVNYYLVKVRRK